MQDRDRALNERGKEDAEELGRIFGERGMIPELMVSSPAVRARQTAEAVCSGMNRNVEIREEDLLYFSSVDDYMTALAGLDNDKNRIMTVGHNPVTEDLIFELTGARLQIETCSLCRIIIDIGEWQELQALAGSMEVAEMIAPG